MIQITEKPIEVQQIINDVTRLGAGAINVFLGTVRDNANGKKVMHLEYEAYEIMAIEEIKKIVNEASTRWSILAHGVVHRVGTLHPGEASVVIAVSTPHRADSFAACQFIIDTLKQKAPIWKKEVFEGGEEWIAAKSN